MDVKPGYKQTEVGVIPEDWEVKPADDLCRVNQGLQIPISNRLKTPSSKSRKYITIQYLNEAKELEYIDDYTPSVCCNENDVLMTRTGNTGIVVTGVEGVFHNNFFKINYDKKLLQKEYLVNYLSQERLQRLILEKAGTSTIPDLNHSDFYSIPIIVPPLPEQEAIAEALSDVDKLLGSLEKFIAKKRAIKQAAMQQLLTGKTRLQGFDRAWETKRIGDIVDVDPENLSSNTPSDFTFNYISLEQVDAGGLLGYSEMEFGTAPSRARRVLRPGDVLMSTVRPNLRAHLLYQEQVPDAVCSTGFAVLRAKPGLSNPAFLFAHLFSPVVAKQIDRILVGSSYPAINSRDVGLLKIPCPPEIHEQHTISEILSDMDAGIVALERRRDKTRAIKQGMMQALLTGRIRLFSDREGNDRGP